MEQKTINQNKLLTILCIIALTIGVLVSAVLFSMPPVHAEESAISYDYSLDLFSNYPTEKQREIHFTFTAPYSKIVAYCYQTSGSLEYYTVRYYDQTDNSLHNLSQSVCTWHSEGTYYKISGMDFSDDNNPNHFYTSFSTGTSGSGSDAVTTTFKANFPVFDSQEHAYAYVQTGDKTGMLNEPETPNSTDESYTFTGFSINGKTARWTGTTERSHLKDQDVEEYTTITYAWATTTEPDNIGTFQEYNGEFPTSAKQLKLPWSDMESGKVDFQFIRQVNIIPCYRVPGAFYHGQAVKIFFKPDGTLDRIEQVTIPSDSETIGNDISLIGFRYDSSFHAEWVDVWSNGANKSAFDLTGSQYLSLGIKAVYYDGLKSDIDFFTLDLSLIHI